MAMSQSALSELLDAICAGGSIDVMREAMAVVLQELIELVGRARRGWRPEQAPGASAQPIGQPAPPMRSRRSAAAARRSRSPWGTSRIAVDELSTGLDPQAQEGGG